MKEDIWQLADLSPISLGHAFQVSQWKFTFQGHPFHRLYYLETGGFTLNYADSETRLQAGDFCLVPANYSFSYSSQEASDHFYYHFNSVFLNHLPFFNRPLVVHGDEALAALRTFRKLWSLFPACERQGAAQENHCYSLMFLPGVNELPLDARMEVRIGLFALLLPFFRLIEEHVGAYDSEEMNRFSKVLEYVDRHVSCDIQIEELLPLVQMCQSRFSALFRQQFGLPPKQYICAKKINRALMLLLETDMTVAQIARDVGYKDEFFFYRIFKKYKGLSPSTWRRNFKMGLIHYSPPGEPKTGKTSQD